MRPPPPCPGAVQRCPPPSPSPAERKPDHLLGVPSGGSTSSCATVGHQVDDGAPIIEFLDDSVDAAGSSNCRLPSTCAASPEAWQAMRSENPGVWLPCRSAPVDGSSPEAQHLPPMVGTRTCASDGSSRHIPRKCTRASQPECSPSGSPRTRRASPEKFIPEGLAIPPRVHLREEMAEASQDIF